MKVKLLCGATGCLMLAAVMMVAANTPQKAVLDPTAPQVLSATGTLPVRIEHGDPLGKAAASILALVGLGMGVYATLPKSTRKKVVTTGEKPKTLEQVVHEVNQLALQNPKFRKSLEREVINRYMTQMGIPVDVTDVADFVVEMPIPVEAPKPASAPPQTGKQSQPEKVKEEVQRPKSVPVRDTRFDAPEYQWILRFLAQPCRRIFGEQGSGKTSKLAFVAAEGIKLGWRVELVNPFHNAGSFKGLKVWGAGLNYSDGADSVEAGLKAFTEEAWRRLKRRGVDEDYDPLKDEQHWHLLCDEVSNWNTAVEENVMGKLMEVCTQFLRQANMSITFVSHGDTNAMNGGSALDGKKAALNNQFCKLETMAVPDKAVPGGMRCAGEATLYVPRQPQKTVKVPPWMREPEGHDYRPLIAAVKPKTISINKAKEVQSIGA